MAIDQDPITTVQVTPSERTAEVHIYTKYGQPPISSIYREIAYKRADGTQDRPPLSLPSINVTYTDIKDIDLGALATSLGLTEQATVLAGTNGKKVYNMLSAAADVLAKAKAEKVAPFAVTEPTIEE